MHYWGLNCDPPNSHVETWTSECDCSRDKTFKEVMSSAEVVKVCPNPTGLASLRERLGNTRRCSLPGRSGKDSERAAVCKPGRGCSTRTESTASLLHTSTLRSCKKENAHSRSRPVGGNWLRKPWWTNPPSDGLASLSHKVSSLGSALLQVWFVHILSLVISTPLPHFFCSLFSHA